MANLIEFLRMFLSYLLVFGVTCVLAMIAITIGIKTRIAKDAKAAAAGSEATTEDI